MSAVAKKSKLLPVVEVFGPTIQGEGWLAGAPTYFVRLGGCDWRCSWCDSLHAVLPEEVRKAERLAEEDILMRLNPDDAEWVTLSGGNPALHDLRPLVHDLHRWGMKVAVETQGSRWARWFEDVDHLTVSPKPPSSGMAGEEERVQVDAFMSELRVTHELAASLKIVVFDYPDLEWALWVADRFRWLPFYISSGTRSLEQEPLEATAERYRQVCEWVAKAGTTASRRARVLPQLHVIAWGHSRGV
jgi:7-carboxy-7-deazaguanine synthase